MIEFNLLPDVKKQYIASQQYARKINATMVGLIVAVLGLVIMMFSLNTVQKSNSTSLDKQIATATSQLSGTADIDKILTIQNQLKTLPSLHAQKPSAIRLFRYLPQLTPKNASISQLSVNYSLNALKIQGSADSLEVVNKFVDTLKFTTFTTNLNQTSVNAFSSVVLSSFGRDDKGATYTIDIQYNKSLFDNAVSVTLKVPQNYTTTRSFTESPVTDLFEGGGAQ